MGYDKEYGEKEKQIEWVKKKATTTKDDKVKGKTKVPKG